MSEGVEPDIAYNRRGLVAPAQAAYVDALGGALAIQALDSLVGCIPGGALVWFALMAGVFSRWLGIGLFAVMIGPTVWVSKRLFADAKARRSRAPLPRPARPVRTVDGFVAWSGSGWRAFEAQASGPRQIGDVALPPGPFRFYVDGSTVVGAESRLGPGFYSVGDNVLSQDLSTFRAESRAGSVPIGDRAAYHAALEATFWFNAEALEANRRGQRLPRQGAGAVELLDGNVQTRSQTTKASGRYELLIAGRALPVRAAALSVVAVGLRHRAYVDPERSQILSIEAV